MGISDNLEGQCTAKLTLCLRSAQFYESVLPLSADMIVVIEFAIFFFECRSFRGGWLALKYIERARNLSTRDDPVSDLLSQTRKAVRDWVTVQATIA